MRNLFIGLLLIFTMFLISCTPSEEISVTYIFASHCNSCTEAEKRMDALAGSYKKAGGDTRLNTELLNVLIPKYYDPAMELIDSMDIPSSARNLPLLIIEDSWFYGEDDIYRVLDVIESGRLPGT